MEGIDSLFFMISEESAAISAIGSKMLKQCDGLASTSISLSADGYRINLHNMSFKVIPIFVHLVLDDGDNDEIEFYKTEHFQRIIKNPSGNVMKIPKNRTESLTRRIAAIFNWSIRGITFLYVDEPDGNRIWYSLMESTIDLKQFQPSKIEIKKEIDKYM